MTQKDIYWEPWGAARVKLTGSKDAHGSSTRGWISATVYGAGRGDASGVLGEQMTQGAI